MRWDRCGEIQRQKVRAYLVLGLLSAALAVVLHLLYHRHVDPQRLFCGGCGGTRRPAPGLPDL